MLLTKNPLRESPPRRRPGISAEVLRDLRTADGAGMRRPDAPKRNPLASPLGAEHALDRLSCIVGVYDCIAAEVEALLATLAELAPLTAKAVA